MRGRGTADYKLLEELPLVKLQAQATVEPCGDDRLVHVRLANPTGRSPLVQVALTRGRGGEEILPVFWEDNYFSLLPGETRAVTARFARRDLGGKEPVLEVGGWNIATDYRCTDLSVSRATVKVGEPLAVTARLDDTFLDGSRVTLAVDGQPAAIKWAWARGGKADPIVFRPILSQSGRHVLSVGTRDVVVTAQSP